MPEADAPSDPLEAEGQFPNLKYMDPQLLMQNLCSTHPLRAACSSQGRTVIHRGARENTQEHSRKHEYQSQVVESFPDGCTCWGRCLPSLVVETLFRGRQQ